MSFFHNFFINTLGLIPYGHSYLIPVKLPWKLKKSVNTSSYIFQFLRLNDSESVLEDGRFVLILGPHWLGLFVTFAMTYFSHHVHTKLINKLALEESMDYNYKLFLLIMCILILFFLLLTSFTNPGIYFNPSLDYIVNNHSIDQSDKTKRVKASVDEESEPVLSASSSSSLSYRRYDNTSLYSVNSNTKSMKYCEECEFQVCQTCHHCDFCGYCIDDLDHHCPWIGQCIGIYLNIITFFIT